MSFLFSFYSFSYYIIYYFLLFPYYFLLFPFKICFLSKFAPAPFFSLLPNSLFHYQILRLITKFSIYPYLSTYKIYIKIRGEDLVPCRGERNPIPLISRRGSARVRRGHSILIPGALCEGFCLPPTYYPAYPPLRTPCYKPARVRRGPSLVSFRGILPIAP